MKRLETDAPMAPDGTGPAYTEEDNMDNMRDDDDDSDKKKAGGAELGNNEE